MAVRRIHRFHPVQQLRDEMDRLFTDFFPNLSASAANSRGYPALNVWEDADHVYCEAEVPDLKQDQLDVSLVGNQLSIRGNRAEPSVDGGTYHRRERNLRSFERTLRLPVDVDGDQVQASLADGVLLITLPKAKAARPRKIAVTAGA